LFSRQSGRADGRDFGRDSRRDWLILRDIRMKIRPASDADLPQIVEIVNALLSTTTIEWTDRPHTLEGRRAWLAQHQSDGDPVLVAEEQGEIIGFACYSDFRDSKKWPGYRFSVEHTVHVRQTWWNKGIGRQLLVALIEHARAAGKHVLIAAIDGDNLQSIEFHRRLGFREVARMPEVGFKQDHWLSLVFMQLSVS
jgi:L-amino acid N-acyltransferase